MYNTYAHRRDNGGDYPTRPQLLTITLPKHPDAVFMSVVEMQTPQALFAGFYRTKYDSYETGLLLKTYQTGPYVQFAKHLPAFTRRR